MVVQASPDFNQQISRQRRYNNRFELDFALSAIHTLHTRRIVGSRSQLPSTKCCQPRETIRSSATGAPNSRLGAPCQLFEIAAILLYRIPSRSVSESSRVESLCGEDILCAAPSSASSRSYCVWESVILARLVDRRYLLCAKVTNKKSVSTKKLSISLISSLAGRLGFGGRVAQRTRGPLDLGFLYTWFG